MSVIIPVNPPAEPSSGGGSYIYLFSDYKCDISGKYVKVTLNGTDIFAATIPSEVHAVSVTITEAGTYTVAIYSSSTSTSALYSHSVNVTSLAANYSVSAGNSLVTTNPSTYPTGAIRKVQRGKVQCVEKVGNNLKFSVSLSGFNSASRMMITRALVGYKTTISGIDYYVPDPTNSTIYEVITQTFTVSSWVVLTNIVPNTYTNYYLDYEVVEFY